MLISFQFLDFHFFTVHVAFENDDLSFHHLLQLGILKQPLCKAKTSHRCNPRNDGTLYHIILYRLMSYYII